MFGDIYNFKKELVGVNLNKYRIDPRCIECGSTNFNIINRWIPSPGSMTKKYQCMECSAIWLVTVNSKFKITKVEKYI